MKNRDETKDTNNEEEYFRQLVFKNTIENVHDKFLKTKEFHLLPGKVRVKRKR